MLGLNYVLTIIRQTASLKIHFSHRLKCVLVIKGDLPSYKVTYTNEKSYCF